MARRPLVDKAAVAEYLGTTVRHVEFLVYRREIPFTKVGRYVRFNLDQVDAWLTANESEAS